MRRATPVVWLLLAAACASPAADLERSSSTREAIVGGWDAPDDGAVVALVAPAGVVCSGTLVGPRAILTAAHCALGGPVSVAFSGAGLDAPVAVPIASFIAHPEFDAATLANDVALVTLAEVAPDAIAPAILSKAPLGSDFVGWGVRVVGFGRASESNDVRRLQGWSTVSEITETSLRTVPGPSQPCHGDSGGPAFAWLDETEVLVGVISSGDPACADHANITRADAFSVSFLAPMLAAVADGASRVGQRCYQPASCVAGAECFAGVDGSSTYAYCTRSCEGDGECLPGMTCDGSRCVFPTPPGRTSSSCIVDTDCDSLHCARQSGVAVCADTCIPNILPCKDGFTCAPDVAHPAQHACFVEVAPSPDAPAKSAPPDAAPLPIAAPEISPLSPPSPASSGGCAAAPRAPASTVSSFTFACLIACFARRAASRTRTKSQPPCP